MQRILILDDDRMICLHLKTLLTAMGYTVGFIINPSILFQRLEHESCDLIIMDVNMPKITGLELLQQCKEHPVYKEIPVLMLTADHSDQVIVDCLSCGASDFLTKPVRKAVLKARIQTALAAQQNKQHLELLVEERTREIKHISKTFQRFVPKQFLERILSGQFDTMGGFEKSTLSILFLDIQGYTSLVEKMTPEENFLFLNTLYEMLEPIILKHAGFVDKYIGDAMMALFEGEHSANHAVEAAIEMQQVMNRHNQVIEILNKKNIDPNKKPEAKIYIRVGINTGEVMLGTVGSPTRLNSTVLGDHVNLASRLEGLNKQYSSSILISHYTHEALNPRTYRMREVDTLLVRGRDQPVLLYDIFEGDSEEKIQKKQKTQFLLLAGIAHYKAQNFERASQCFYKALAEFPEDILLLDYLKRCRYFQKYPLEEWCWDGVLRTSTELIDHTLRRVSKRHVIGLPFQISPYSDPQLCISGSTLNVSHSGCSGSVSQYVAARSLARLSFSASQSEEAASIPLTSALIRIVWIEPQISQNSEPTWSLGFEFVVLEEQQEESLELFLNHLR